MRLRDYFGLVLKSLNPNRHRDLVKLPFFDLVKYFFFLFGLCLVGSLLILAPTMSNYKQKLGGELDSFDEFSISIDAEMGEPITVLEKPKVLIDFSKDNMSSEWVLVNNESIMYNKFIFFGEDEAVFSDYKSVKSDKSSSLYSKIVIFLLPALVFWVAILFLLKYAVLMSLFSLLGWVFFLSGQHHLALQNSMKTALFAATPMVIFDVLLWPLNFALVSIIPVLLYLVYFAMGVVMASERKYSNDS